MKATKTHARNLATFATIYKMTLIALKHLSPASQKKEGSFDTFIAGLLGGYVVFGRNRTSVAQQVCSNYNCCVFSRDAIANI